MFAQKILRCYSSMVNRRFISQSAKNFENKASDSVNKAGSSTSNISESVVGPHWYVTSNFDKWLLVWVKRFPKGQVPDKISPEIIYQAKSRGRIKAANYIMGITLLACLFTAYSGKQAVKSGDTLQKRNQEWHRQINEEHQASLALKTEAAAASKS